MRLDTGDVLVIHLRMSGQLLRAAAKDPLPKHTHVVITFTVGGQLRFVDPRTFGEMFVTSPDQLTERSPSWPSWASTRSTRRCRGRRSATC